MKGKERKEGRRKKEEGEKKGVGRGEGEICGEKEKEVINGQNGTSGEQTKEKEDS